MTYQTAKTEFTSPPGPDTYDDRRQEERPTAGEAPFHLGEVFFSRTDERGVILAGNYVFRRVAGYDWPEMLNAPHKLIRHPDMPKAVFWLLWNRIKQGQPVGAYVKNLAKDGLYYWVFAVVSPIEGGYLSARIKPTSPMRDLVEKEYATLLAAEKKEGLTPEESANRLLARIEELGFADYEQFEAHALREELQARDQGLKKNADHKLARFEKMIRAAEALQEETKSLIIDFHATRTIPHNMQVIASRLEPTGGPVSTLSKNYGAISREMSEWFQHYVVGEQSNFAMIQGSVNNSMFLESIARILVECDHHLNLERRSLGEVDLEKERRVLGRQVNCYVKKSSGGIAKVREEADRIKRACDTMHRHVLGLSSTRVLSKIESGRTPDASDALSGIISQLGTFQERINGRLEKIALHSQTILDLTE